MSDDADSELQKFREQWKEEVIARSKRPTASKEYPTTEPPGSFARKSEIGQASTAAKPPVYSRIGEIRPEKADDENSGNAASYEYHDLVDKDEARRLGTKAEGPHPSVAASKTPSSALELYEKAVEREDQGSLGDSISLYRKAYRLDAGVDKVYRNKHFPPTSDNTIPADSNPSNSPVTVPGTAHHSLDGPPVKVLDIPQLIASFAGLPIVPVPPPTDQSPQPPCPISSIPSEILIHILTATASLDVAAFARLSLVCKRLAFMVLTEDRIWKRVCLSPESGFTGMHYDWNCTISGELRSTLVTPLDMEFGSSDAVDELSPLLTELRISPDACKEVSHTPSPKLNSTYPTFRAMFRSRPRIRFNGCYISTVNYIRPGASTASQISWNTPVHIITYYRYLRFFRDGSCVSLLTTAEPADVVHHLSKANVPHSAQHGKANPSSLPPMSIMQHALRGRWKLQSPASESKEEPEGTLSIETLGIDPDKYTYVLSLALQSTRRKEGTRNNKLAWRGFWSYNKLTDDWAEFGLKNDKPFIWSRVGSYGMGE